MVKTYWFCSFGFSIRNHFTLPDPGADLSKNILTANLPADYLNSGEFVISGIWIVLHIRSHEIREHQWDYALRSHILHDSANLPV